MDVLQTKDGEFTPATCSILNNWCGFVTNIMVILWNAKLTTEYIYHGHIIKPKSLFHVYF